MERIESLTRDDTASGTSFLGRAQLARKFAKPAAGLETFLARLGSPMFTMDYPIDQYVVWAEASGLFELMERRGSVTIADVCRETRLNEEGADALLGMLCALELATRSAAGRYALSPEGQDYGLRSSPYYIVDQFRSYGKPLPRPYVERERSFLQRMAWKLKSLRPSVRYGAPGRLMNQHARNLPACATAARSGEFKDVKCLVDIAGGSGVFAIPLAFENRTARIVLTELPEGIVNIRPYLIEHGLEGRIELLGMNVLEYPWPIPSCDGVFIGNFLHGFRDEACRRVCAEAFRHLAPGGKIWIHEMIWNENKDGPLLTAILNAAMRNGPGLQRTAREITSILESVGFVEPYVVPTAGAYALVAASKPSS